MYMEYIERVLYTQNGQIGITMNGYIGKICRENRVLIDGYDRTMK